MSNPTAETGPCPSTITWSGWGRAHQLQEQLLFDVTAEYSEPELSEDGKTFRVTAGPSLFPSWDFYPALPVAQPIRIARPFRPVAPHHDDYAPELYRRRVRYDGADRYPRDRGIALEARSAPAEDAATERIQ